MIVWLDEKLAQAIHDRQIAEHGGTTGLRDASLLQSALARPQQRYAYGDPIPDLAELAASLAYGIARNHPFVDGNKRSAAVCCEVFLALNECLLKASDADFYVAIMALAQGQLGEQDFATWLREHLSAPLPPQVQEAKPAARRPGRKRAIAG